MATVKTKDEPIVIERIFAADPVTVWDAITDTEKMKHWYFDMKGFKPEEGSEFQFLAGDDRQQYLHICKVTEVIPERKLSYSWRYEHDPGISNVTFEIFPEGENTRLRLTHRGTENFSSEHPELATKNFLQGWDQIINKNLKDFLGE